MDEGQIHFLSSLMLDTHATSTTSATSTDDLGQEEIACAVKLINRKEPQFILQVSVGGQWGRVLIDTGATTSFCSSKFAEKHFSNVAESSSNLNIRLGDASVCPVNKYITEKTTYSNKTITQTFWLLNLPPGIDAIVGLDWMREMHCLLDPPNRRIILMDSEDNVNSNSNDKSGDFKVKSASTASFVHIQPTDAYLAYSSEVESRKSINQDVFALSNTNNNSDIMVTSTNCLNKLLKLYNSGNLTHDSIEQFINIDHTITRPDKSSTADLKSDGNTLNQGGSKNTSKEPAVSKKRKHDLKNLIRKELLYNQIILY